MPSAPITVFLEIGSKRTFAGAIEWPGWCRSGRDEASALAALIAYGPRYAAAVRSARLGFKAPAGVDALSVIERVQGNATTDFGAPGASPAADAKPLAAAGLKRAQAALNACWRAFLAAAEAAEGKELKKGPRGGGRDLSAIFRHVLDSEAGYLGALGWKFKRDEQADLGEELARLRRAALEGLAASARGEIPARGPRGGLRWTARYYVRRSAWHILDHAWEIEDRIE